MDSAQRRQLDEYLVRAEQHVLDGERLLARQRSRIEEARRNGHDVELATELLAEMEQAQRQHIEDRDRLRRELSGERSGS